MNEDEELILSYSDREKIIHLLERYKNSSSDAPLSSATRCYSVDATSSTLIEDLFSELENVDVKDLAKEGSAKNFANFLIDLTSTIPDIVLNNIYHLLPHLDGENFTLRNAVLTVLANLLECRLKGDDLDDEEKEIRDKFMEHLREHIHDKTAFVRSKCLQLWVILAVTQSVPLSILKEILPVIVGRVADKAATVRKAAIQFLTAILKGIPAMVEAAQTLLTSVFPQISIMLRQQQHTDVMEAVEFVVTCYEHDVQGSINAFWDCCRLIWSKEQPIKDIVVRAFQRLFFVLEGDTERTRNVATVKNLISLTSRANLSQQASLEEIMSEITKRQLISPSLCRIFWEIFSMHFPGGSTFEESKSALKLIGMMAKAEKSIISDNMDLLIEFGFGERAKRDFELPTDAFYALQNIAFMPRAKGEEAMKIQPYRLSDNHPLFNKINTLVVEGYSRIDDPMWTPMAERAVHVIFAIADHPNELAASLLKGLVDQFKEDKDASTANCRLLRLLVVIGQVGLQTFINLDVSVCRELKRRTLINEEIRLKRLMDRRKAAKQHQEESGSPLSTDSTFTEDSRKRKLAVKTPRAKVSTIVSASVPIVIDDDDELTAMVGASADDLEYEFVSKLCEEEVLAENSILGQLSKLVLVVCQNPHKYKGSNLQTTAALALSKLMLVSSKFAEANMQLFFTLLDRSDYAAVRANLVIAVGDLSFRFPNLIEPWTATVYRRLQDDDLTVKLNCLLILTHLILNDMIKPKGNLANIALCMSDMNEHVSNLSKKFFNEYADKGNSLYNLLPDIVGRLTDRDPKLEFEDLKSILKFLFSLVRKEKQHETLIEKLSTRFEIIRQVFPKTGTNQAEDDQV